VRASVIRMQKLARNFIAFRRLSDLRIRHQRLREQCALKIQSTFRMRKSVKEVRQRRLAFNFASAQIQKIWRSKLARRRVKRMRFHILYMQACVRRFLEKCRFRAMLRERAERMQNVVDLEMGELHPLIHCDHMFSVPGALVAGDQDKYMTMRSLCRYKMQIRYLYMKFACEGVGDPSKAFKMSKHQFIHMCEELRHTKGYDKTSVKEFKEHSAGKIFEDANEDCNIAERLKVSLEGVAVKADYAQEVDRVVEQHEFACCLVRLAINRYQQVLCTGKSAQMAVTMYMEDLLMPWYEKKYEADCEEKNHKAELISKIAQPQVVKYASKIKKLFKKVSASGGAGNGGNDDAHQSVDCGEFLNFCKSGKMCDSSFSMSDALDVYMYCNQEEMKDYLTRVRPLSDINDEMAMDIDEFVDGILLMSACKLKITGGVSDKKLKEYTSRFQKLLEDLIENGCRAFDHM